MASTRNHVFLFALAASLLIIVSHAVKMKNYNPTCSAAAGSNEVEDSQACDKEMAELFAKASTVLVDSNLKAFNVTVSNPCDKCLVKGVQHIKIYNVTESKVVDCGEKEGKCVDHVIYFKIPQLDCDCQCEVATDPSKCAREMQDQMQKPNMGMPCEEAPPSVAQNLPKPDVQGVCGKPENFAKLQSCRPKGAAGAPNVGGFGKREAPERVKGTIVIDWEKVNLKVYIRACEKQKDVVFYGAALVDPDKDAMKMTCKGEEDFMESCKCILEANFMKVIMLQTIQMAFPCYADQACKGHEEDINKLHCKKVYF